MPDPCPLCGDSGMYLLERPDGSRAARECECRAQRRQLRQLAAARIPDRYTHCTLDDYEPGFAGANGSLSKALVMARSFVRSYPLETDGNGLLLTGSIGVGKTHLAIGILRALMQERGALGLFYDYRDLLKQIQNSYNKAAGPSEMEILRPVFEAEVLVLDELGAGKPTEWVWETVAHVLNTRYNDRRTTDLLDVEVTGRRPEQNASNGVTTPNVKKHTLRNLGHSFEAVKGRKGLNEPFRRRPVACQV